jgi:hypothetical protein
MLKARVTIGMAALLILAGSLAASGQQPDNGGRFRVGLPWKDWAFDMRLSAFNLPAAKVDRRDGTLRALVLATTYSPRESFGDDGREYRLRVSLKDEKDDRGDTSLNVVVKPLTPVVGAAEFRAAELKNIGRDADLDGRTRHTVKGDSVKTSDHKDALVARYATTFERVREHYVGGKKDTLAGKAEHIAAYYVRDGVGVILTLSTRSVKEEEEKLFYSVLDSVRVVDTSSPSSSFDHYHRGRLLFLQKDYPRAAASLDKALTLERTQRQLDADSLRDLVAKLIDAYGASGDVARASEVLDYALTQEPENPLFHMTRARIYASRGDTDAALASLEKAFSYMKKENPRARLPDLTNDPAFGRYLKDERFNKAVKEMRK